MQCNATKPHDSHQRFAMLSFDFGAMAVLSQIASDYVCAYSVH